MNEQDLIEYIPHNALNNGTFLNIPYQNWFECVVTTGIICTLIFNSIFVMKIKVICAIVIGLANMIFFLKGIQNKSVFQFIKNAIKTQQNKAEYHLGSIDNEQRTIKEEDFGRKSYAEKVYSGAKRKLKEFDQKYGN